MKNKLTTYYLNFDYKLILIIISLITITVRIISAFKGGQFFIVDELRYVSGHHFISFFSDFEFFGGIKYLLNCSAHTLFTLFAGLAEVVRYLFVIIFIDSSLQPYQLNNSTIGIEISAIFLSSASVLNILLIYLVIRSFNGSKLQGLIASVLLSLSITNFYFSRHLVPYDCSISLSLISFYFAGKSRTSAKYQFLCGIFSCLSTLTYFGYWPLSFVAWLSCILRNRTNYFRVALFCGGGGLSPLILIQVIGFFAGVNYLQNVWDFITATKTNQMGDYFAGFDVFFDYLWKAESILFYVMLSLTSLSIFFTNLSSGIFLNHRRIGIFSSVSILLILFYLSEIEGSFVLYGRTIKMVIPFTCIACSYPLFVLMKIHKNQLYSHFILYSFFGLFIISSFNHLNVLNIVYPNDFKDKAIHISDNFEEVSSLSGVNIRKLEKPNSNSPYCLVNAQWLVPPLSNTQKSIPNGDILLKETHPYSSFPPYLFLHYNKEERQIMQNNKLEMLLVKKL